MTTVLHSPTGHLVVARGQGEGNFEVGVVGVLGGQVGVGGVEPDRPVAHLTPPPPPPTTTIVVERITVSQQGGGQGLGLGIC